MATRLGDQPADVKRLIESDGPPRYRREPTGSMADEFEGVIRKTLEDWPDIKRCG